MAAEVIAEEYDGAHLRAQWHRDATGRVRLQQTTRQYREAAWLRLSAAAFLPDGYPASVTEDYISFQAWDSVQALCSYIRGMLTSQALLVGVGMGQKAANPTAAVFQFLMRDLSGMVGGTVFAFVQGSDLDSHAKQWRLFADCFNNVGYALELASPIFPQAFLIMSCLGSIARAITGVAGGATRAALTQHFAQHGNAADVSAKEGSQETATTLVGMLLGMAFLHISTGSSGVIWGGFLLLTGVHIYANVRAVRALRLSSLNAPRLQLLLSHALQHPGAALLTPRAVAAEESLLAPPVQQLLLKLQGRRGGLCFGARLSAMGTASEVEQLCAASHGAAYLLRHDQGSKTVHVALRRGLSPQEKLQAYAHGWVLLHCTQLQAPAQAQRAAEEWMATCWPSFRERLGAAGWYTQLLALGKSKAYAEWGLQTKAQ